MNEVQEDNHHLSARRDIKRLVGDEILWYKSGMFRTGFFITNNVARNILFIFETYAVGNMESLQVYAFRIMHPNWNTFGNVVEDWTQNVEINLLIDFVE